MRIIDEAALEGLLEVPALIEALRAMFRDGCAMPTRHHHYVATPEGGEGTLLLMPAWQEGRYLGVKIVTVFGDNPGKGLPSVLGQYFLLDANTGAPLALLDGPCLTRRRTAAASALAAGYLARDGARRLLMVGAGSLAPHLIEAHAAVRPIDEVRLWSRTAAHAEALAAELNRPGLGVRPTRDLAADANWAEVICCATLATEPLILGDWLSPGAHLDLVGAFRPDMREADDAALRRARLFVDTRAGALKEAGDIVQAIAGGAITEADIAADLHELAGGAHPGRRDDNEITLFKSVGAALEDLAAARLAYEGATAGAVKS